MQCPTPDQNTPPLPRSADQTILGNFDPIKSDHCFKIVFCTISLCADSFTSSKFTSSNNGSSKKHPNLLRDATWRSTSFCMLQHFVCFIWTRLFAKKAIASTFQQSRQQFNDLEAFDKYLGDKYCRQIKRVANSYKPQTPR